MLALEGTTLDEHLGQRSGRYFGEGYLKVDSRLENVVLIPAESHSSARRLRGSAHIRFPTEWSKKGRMDQVPHLSTVDAVAISWRAARAIAGTGIGRVTNLTFVPGSHSLEGNPVLCDVIAEERPAAQGKRNFRVDIGGMKVLLECDARSHTSEKLEDDTDELSFTDAWPDFSSLHSREEGQTLVAGVERRGHPDARLTVVDAFVAVIQLGQVLLYRLDAVERAASNTLWLRRGVFSRASDVPAENFSRCQVSLTSVVTMPRGGSVWRGARVVGTVGGIAIDARVAHRLPDCSQDSRVAGDAR